METPPDPGNVVQAERRSATIDDPHIFSPEFGRDVRGLVYVRAEIAVTLVVDGVLILLAVAVRWALLRGLHMFAPPDEMNWSLKVVEFVLNFGLVGTVIIVTGFDLLKRIRNGYRSLRDSK